MDRKYFYSIMSGKDGTDYETYLNTPRLLSCQKAPELLSNHDEMQFQLVHQMQELSMKLIAFTLLEIDELLEKRLVHRIQSLFNRVHLALRNMIDQLTLLETMSPRDYQEIRIHLGRGSGQESPGFRTLMKMYEELWESYKKHYLHGDEKTLLEIYDSKFSHSDAYVIAESLAEYDELFQKFRFNHIQLIHRSIGLGAKSLKGRSVQLLDEGLKMKFFPALWEVRNQMTNRWGQSYGTSRPTIPNKPKHPRRRKDDKS